VVRAGAVITVTFNSDIVIDLVTVSNPGSLGFTYFDNSAPPSISSITTIGTTQLQINLSGVPVGSGKVLRYGYSSGSSSAGPTTGRRGNIRNNDPDVSQFGNSLADWCVCFEEAAT